MGNGNEQSGDGWKYRGRGFIQITGKENYSNLSKDTGIDFLSNPDLLLQEPNAIISALWFWHKNDLNSYADTGDLIGLTRRINGGLNGIEHRKELLLKWKKLLKI
jgi:putative chitinase